MDKTNIEDYLFNIYKSNTRMYKKLYYQKNKKRIFEAAGFKPEKKYEDAAVYLQDEVVLKTIKRWD